MRQLCWVAAGILFLSLATGCACHRGGELDCFFNGCCHGPGCSEKYHGCDCGEAYYGDWHSHPPQGNPCDCYGNYTGHSGCTDCKHLNSHRHEEHLIAKLKGHCHGGCGDSCGCSSSGGCGCDTGSSCGGDCGANCGCGH
ncbi:MAG: hypothetical protein SFX18_06705 [Pirellulales bacterium]|nr:hypothetical protein [Pirellulales bacterium]